MESSINNSIQNNKNLATKDLLWIVCWFFFIFYSLIHFVVIYKTSVNIPFWDEWEILNPQGIILGWSKDYLYPFHNEHRIVPTKILYLVNLYLFNLNFRYQILINAIIYAGLVISVWRLIGRKIKPIPSYLGLFALIPFISTLPLENHTTSFQNNMHICLWSFMGGAYLIFTKKQWLPFFCGLILWIVSIFSLAQGVAGVATGCLFFVIWSVLKKDKSSILKSLFALGLIALFIFVWSQGYQKNPGHAAYTIPWDFHFLRFFGEIISLGFGFTDVNIVSAYLCLLIVFLALFISSIFNIKNKRQDTFVAFLISLTFGILAMLALVTFGRGNFPIIQAKVTRYAEISIFLPILSLALFNLNKMTRKFGNIVVCSVLLLGFFNNFNFSGYHWVQKIRMEGARCVKDLLENPQNNPQGSCPATYPGGLNDKLSRAKQLGLSFIKR